MADLPGRVVRLLVDDQEEKPARKNRRREDVLSLIRLRPMTENEIADALDIDRSAANYHIDVLKKLGEVVSVGRRPMRSSAGAPPKLWSAVR